MASLTLSIATIIATITATVPAANAKASTIVSGFVKHRVGAEAFDAMSQQEIADECLKVLVRIMRAEANAQRQGEMEAAIENDTPEFEE